jgi:hypothetical protein
MGSPIDGVFILRNLYGLKAARVSTNARPPFRIGFAIAASQLIKLQALLQQGYWPFLAHCSCFAEAALLCVTT